MKSKVKINHFQRMYGTQNAFKNKVNISKVVKNIESLSKYKADLLSKTAQSGQNRNTITLQTEIQNTQDDKEESNPFNENGEENTSPLNLQNVDVVTPCFTSK
jgi:hypothetical protein